MKSEEVVTSAKLAPPVGVEPMKFTEVSTLFFKAEYTVKGDDFIIHFFPLPDKNDREYWLQVFPTVLDVTARTHFRANKPQLRAAYTEELDSWWLRADGYPHILAKEEFIKRFFNKLAYELKTTTSTKR